MTHISLNRYNERRFDVDWLRTIAFILLIFYHIGQFYVLDWSWHVKSAYQSEFLQNFMLLLNQWRMPLIFVISGIALSLVEPKISMVRLFKLRFIRVLVPLVIGIYLIVPPQLYYELKQGNGYLGSYLEFMHLYVDPNTLQFPEKQYTPAGLLTWNHLWYLAYLWHYTLAFILLKPFLSRVNYSALVKRPSIAIIILIPTVLLILYSRTLQPIFGETNALVDDWYNHARYFTMFMLGYILAKMPVVWEEIIKKRQLVFSLAIIGAVLMIMRFNRLGFLDIEFEQASFMTQNLIYVIWRGYTVLCLLTVIGYAGAYLNRKSPILSYMNEAILPWYILHQTVIIIVAMNLANFSLGPVLEPFLVIIFTFGFCALGYEIIKRFNFTRFIFGMKLKPSNETNAVKLGFNQST